MDRPVTLKSGVALQSNYSVQHRSDILMEEQLETVVKLQAELKAALSDLESARTDDQLEKCRAAVQECKEKSEKAIMVFQVLTKINTELSFARAELEEALEKQEGDINEARKRVMWLEDRMGVLCGKARLRIQPTQKPKKRFRSPDRSTFCSRLGSDSDKSSASSYVGDPQRMGRNMSIGIKSDTTQRAAMFSASDSGSDYPAYQQQGRGGIADTPSSDAESFLMAQQKMAGRQGLQDSDSDSDEGMPGGMPPGLQGMPPMSGPILKPRAPDWESESEYESQGQPQTRGMPAPVETDSQDTHSQRQADEVTTTVGETVRSEEPSSRVTESQADQTEDYTETTTGVEETTEDVTESQTETQDRDSAGETTERGDMSETSGTSTPHYSEDGQDTQAFITEVPNNKSVTVQSPKRKPTKKGHRRVTFRDMLLEEIKQQEEEGEDPSPVEEDRARDYWFSEHHRFEYSQYSDVLLELDPLSYHNVGLALPGSFIEKPQRAFSDLPWRSRRKGSDINDIHKLALDKLAGRVHTMYDKFYDAALLSVRPTQTEEKREATMLSQYDSAQDGGRKTPTDNRPGIMTAPTTADGMPHPQTGAKPMAPAHLRPGLNVYHPKPIPPPELLPLTRMSKDKEFPRLADQFLMEEDFLVHKPAVRIADQRNLYKETKLKLYRDRPKRAEEGPSSMEKKFQLMLEREKSLGTKSGRSSRQSTGKVGPPGTRMSMARTMTKADWAGSEAGASTWSRLKPSSRGKEYGGLKWERVKTVVHVNLVSSRPEERRDAAKHLGVLRCGDAMVFFALKERLRVDEDSRTRYEAAKSLILLGCWDEEVLQLILMFLVTGNSEIRQDLIQTMIDGKNVQYVNKKTATFSELVKVLSHFCRNPDPDDSNAFDSAVLLGKLCVADEYAKFKLLRSLDQSSDTHIKAKALETLVKQLSYNSWEVVQHLLSLFKESPVWKYRALAADLLIVLGKENVCKKGEEEKIYQILERKLWDDPTRDVRISAAKALAALGMFGKACDRIEKRLEDTDEDVRAQAVISVGTLEMKTEKIIRLLLEMLELDASEYVRLMIARTFTVLKLADKRVLRALRERDKVEGALARESRKALKVLESFAGQHALTSPTGRRSMVSRATPRGITPRYTPAAIA